MLGRIIIGLIGIAVGFLLVWQSEWIYENFGTNAWAEKNLGTSGGTMVLIKLIGIFIIFIFLLTATGMIEGFLQGTIGKLFRFG